jgi:hypothetical protein
MPVSLAVRITLPFSDVSGVVRAWALKADKLLCYEHTGELTEKPHVHLLLINVSVDKERLKQLAKVTGGSRLSGGGNELWSFKTKVKGAGDVSDENSRRYITYMSKGTIDPSYVKGYDEDFLAACKAGWTTKEVSPNRDQQLYSAFEERLYQLHVENPHADIWADGTSVFRHDKANDLAKLARSWAFAAHDQIWSVRTATDAKMVFLTYCMRFDIQIPDNLKVW